MPVRDTQIDAEPESEDLVGKRSEEGHGSVGSTRDREATTCRRAAELAEANRELALRNRLLSVVAEVSTRLARIGDISASLHEALETIGVAGQLSRVLVLEERQRPSPQEGSDHLVIAEWCAPEIESHVDCGTTVIPSELAEDFLNKLRLGQAFWCRVVDMADPLRHTCELMGVKATGCAPLMVDGMYWGNVAFDDCVRPEPWDTAHVDALTAIAQAISNALQTRRDAERLAAERERSARERAAELVKANAILRSTVDVMTSIPALDEFLGTVMVAINDSLGANGSTLWLFDYASDTARLAMTAIDGVWSQYAPAYEEGILAPQFPSGDELQNQRLRSQPTFNPSIQQDIHLDRGTKAWLAHLNVIALQELPIRVGEKVIGSLSIHCEANEPFSSEKLELAIVLTQQLGLAIHITRLAEEAQQAAVAREQEKAAKDQTAQLVRANRSISSSLKDLTAYTDLDGFLGKMLVNIGQQLGEDSGGVWLYDKKMDQLHFQLCLENGVLLDGTWTHTDWIIFDDGPEDVAFDGPSPSRGLRNAVRVHTSQDIETRTEWDFYREVLREQKVRCIMEIPMFVGEELIGFYSLRAKHRENFSAAEIEIAQALANQAALACHVKRLSDEAAEAAKQSAIAAERNRMALELHDTLAQCFTGVLMQLGAAAEAASSNPSLTTACLNRAEQLSRKGLRDARRSVLALTPDSHADEDICAVLRQALQDATAGTGCRGRIEVKGTPVALPLDVRANALRVCQEALANAQQYAQATEIVISVIYASSHVSFCVSDNGLGFDPTRAKGSGFGLVGMQHRADRIGGRIEIESEQGTGTTVRLEIPQEAALEAR